MLSNLVSDEMTTSDTSSSINDGSPNTSVESVQHYQAIHIINTGIAGTGAVTGGAVSGSVTDLPSAVREALVPTAITGGSQLLGDTAGEVSKVLSRFGKKAETVEKAGIRSLFDIGVHLHCDLSGTEIANYVKEVRTYQAKTKKKNLNVYVMATNIDHVKVFGRLGDPSWKVNAISKTPSSDPQVLIIQELAEIKILTAQSALILDYNDPTDRFITLMHRGGPTGPDFLKLMSSQEWYLV
jgi:hypothetical protein